MELIDELLVPICDIDGRQGTSSSRTGVVSILGDIEACCRVVCCCACLMLRAPNSHIRLQA